MSSQFLTNSTGPEWTTPEHHGPTVSIVTWLFIIGVVLVVAARIVTRYAIIHILRWDDITCLLAMFFAIGQSIAVSVQASNGLGSHQQSLSPAQFIRFEKSTYANFALYVVVLGLVKVSVSIHLHGLSPVPIQRTASVAVGGFSALWALTSLFVTLFQCKVPETWNFTGNKCINPLAFWTYFSVLNILTDVALIALPIPIVFRLQVSAGKKAVILACYATRILVIAVTIVQLYYLQRSTTKYTDFTYDSWIPVLCQQGVITTTIISSCFPFLKFLIDALETGMVRADGRTGGTQKLSSSGGGEGGSYFKARGSQFKHTPSRGVGGTAAHSKNLSEVHHSDVLRMSSLNGERDGKNQLQNTATKGSKGDDDLDSQSSQTHIIRKVEWTLTEENAGGNRV